MKKIIMLLLAMAISFWLGRFYVESSAPSAFHSVSVINKSNAELLKLEQRYQQLLSERTSLVSPSSSHSSTNAKAYPKRVLSPMPTREQLEKMIQDRMDFYKRVDVKEVYEVLSKKFEEEGRVSEASAEREALIYELHAQLPDLQKYTLKSVECRDKHCRVEVFYQLLSDVDLVGSDFYDSVSQSEFAGLFLGSAEQIIDQKTNVVAVYLSIDANSSLYD